jgi:hypothetical protein
MKLRDRVRPFVLADATAREAHRYLPGWSYMSVAKAMAKVRREMGLPSANVRAGPPLRLSVPHRSRLKAEADRRGFKSSATLLDAIIDAVISDNLFDALLIEDERAAA